MQRDIKFEYGFSSVNGIIKKVYSLHEIPTIKDKCDLWNVLPIAYVREYTGLKDKNGKEIYEGDIVIATMSGIIKYEFKSIVCFELGCFWIRSLEDLALVCNAKGSFRSFDGCDASKLIEVISNMYENTEI